MISKLMKKESGKLGVSYGRKYDLPLNRDAGAGFLILLISLMTFLAMLALASSFALSAMTERWSSGLESQVTVEIPAETKDGKVLTRTEIKGLTGKINSLLKAHPAVAGTHVLSEDEITNLVEPWLGDSLSLSNVPLPGLISLNLKESDPKALQILETKVKSISPTARIDTHEEWLADLLRFTGALRFASAVLALVIGLTTIIALAGAVRSRMAVHKEEVELLHLMGASDTYISRQFQRHTLILAFQGSLLGLIIGGLSLKTVSWISGEMDVNLLPDFTLNAAHIMGLLCLPAIIALIAIVTTRQTVLHVLSQMP